MRSHYTTRKCRYWCVPHVFTYKVELGEAQDGGPPKGTPSWMVVNREYRAYRDTVRLRAGRGQNQGWIGSIDS